MRQSLRACSDGTDAVTGATRPVTGMTPDKNAPPLVRSDLVRIHTDGTVHLLLPSGPRLRLAADTPAQAVLPIPLDSFAPTELGVFPPRVAAFRRSGRTLDRRLRRQPARRSLGREETRVHQRRTVPPAGDEPAFPRTGTSRSAAKRRGIGPMRCGCPPRMRTARKVHRVILQRDGRANIPAAWVEVKYELANHEKLSGQNFNRAASRRRGGLYRPGGRRHAGTGRDPHRCTHLWRRDFQARRLPVGNRARHSLPRGDPGGSPHPGVGPPGECHAGPARTDERSAGNWSSRSGRNPANSFRMSRSEISSCRAYAASPSFWYSSNRPAKRPISPLPSPRR